MRKIYTFLFGFLLFVGCSKDNNNNNNSEIPELSATVDNAAWNAFTIDTHIVFSLPNMDENFSIFAVTKDGHELSLNIHGAKTGIYKVSQNQNLWAEYQKTSLNHEIYGSNSGEVNLIVDSLNQEISGTFNLVLKSYLNTSDSIVITNGSFNNLRYTYLNKK